MAYNIYEVELNNKNILKVDCSIEDVTMIVIEKDDEIVNSFEVLPHHMSDVASAIAYVLNINNNNIKVTRNVTNDPCWRYAISYYNQILKIRYTEDGNEEMISEIEINICNEDIEIIKKFFNLVAKYEIGGT